MSSVATYVFIDLETTGLPKEENNKTKIIEISLVAVKREHLLITRAGASPRVQHKLTLCLNPRKLVNPGCTEVTGLCNDLLEFEPDFNKDVIDIINGFLGVLTKPVCLIAQNGINFDFPILKKHFEKLNMSIAPDIVCADCYHAFYDILEFQKTVQDANFVEKSVKPVGTADTTDHGIVQTTENKDESSFWGLENMKSLQELNENTPKRPCELNKHNGLRMKKGINKARRRLPWSDGPKPKDSYKLKNIYERVLNRPALEAHCAENDCLMALECSVALGKAFVKWIDENHFPFSDIKPMTIGVPLGQ